MASNCLPQTLRALDGTPLGWWRVDNDRCRVDQPMHLFLTHGAFSDRRVCLGMARAWADEGHVAWVLEWRGHGHSGVPAAPYDMETVAELDVVAALEVLRHQVPPGRLCAATHSGGGLVLTMALLRQPQYQPLFHRMALFACQSSDAGVYAWRHMRLQVFFGLTRLYGRIPARVLRLGRHDESCTMMAPWFRWNLERVFLGRDGFDYKAHQKRLEIPVMAVAGAADRFIAPSDACLRYWRRFGRNPNSAWLLCGTNTGFSRDHGHASVMHSSAAQAEVVPLVTRWLLTGSHPRE
jgi:predicted alpha/beta hydrolase